MQNHKPNGARAGYRVLETAQPYQSEITNLRVDRVEVDGSEVTYSYLQRAPGIIIVPATNDGHVVLIRQYRYPCDDWCLEVPAGGTHDTDGLSFEEVARKELEEEIGATCESLEYVSNFYSCSSLTDEKCHVFLARGVETVQRAQTEDGENIHIEQMPIEEALHLARSGKMKTAPCTLALLLCEPMLRELMDEESSTQSSGFVSAGNL